MKKILLLSFAFFALTSCFDNNTKIEGLPTKEFAESNFTMQIPNEWTASGSIDNLPSLPNGEVVLAAVSPEKKYNFSNNIIVISSKLDYIGTSKQYSEQNNLKTQKKYLEYSLVKSGPIIFGDSDEGKYYIFDARYNAQTQKLRFLQTAKVCGTNVFLLHASVALDADTGKYIDVFRTFTCK